MPYSSNITLLSEVVLGDANIAAIYKPLSGERPLSDFTDGLCYREVAAYRLSADLGWELIPPTVLRKDGPFGVGSLQLFIHANFQEHYFSLMGDATLEPKFIEFAIFDLIGNNADRKSGHILIDGDCQLWGIDNGLMFHQSPKLRTVIWEFGGAELTQSQIQDLCRVQLSANELFDGLINPNEIKAFIKRCQFLSSKKKLPRVDPEARPYPWPLV